jgi:hypothetical protein
MTGREHQHKPSPTADEISDLVERLRKVQALYNAPATEGEKAAAAAAAERLQARLKEATGAVDGARRESAAERETEFQMRIDDAWSRKLFIGIARHHGVRPCRYPGQRRTTLVVRTTKRRLEERIMPHYSDAVSVLRDHFDVIADRVIREALHVSTDEAEVRPALAP